ncbi:MAG: hypothetical protein ACYCSP_02240, partial [Acidobacteriaceae bacterium]
MNQSQNPKGQNPLRLPFASFRLILRLEKACRTRGNDLQTRPKVIPVTDFMVWFRLLNALHWHFLQAMLVHSGFMFQFS